jgi:hypothetical protein
LQAIFKRIESGACARFPYASVLRSPIVELEDLALWDIEFDIGNATLGRVAPGSDFASFSESVRPNFSVNLQ